MNISEIKSLIQATDVCGHVALLKGKHGLGKSDIVRTYAAENNLHCEILMLSLMDTGDLIGMPFKSDRGGTTTTSWAAPVWFTRIQDLAWPLTLDVNQLEFKDKEFEKFVLSNVKS